MQKSFLLLGFFLSKVSFLERRRQNGNDIQMLLLEIYLSSGALGEKWASFSFKLGGKQASQSPQCELSTKEGPRFQIFMGAIMERLLYAYVLLWLFNASRSRNGVILPICKAFFNSKRGKKVDF